MNDHVPEGWVMVPKIPTKEMHDAMVKAFELSGYLDHAYKAAVKSAAPPGEPRT